MSVNGGSLGFDTDIAMKVGVECAVLHKNISYWTEQNKANNRNYFEGRYWTYNSARAFAELFPFWTARKITRMLITLEEDGLILSGEFNKKKYDRTKWYTAICQNGEIHLSKMVNGVTKNVTPIPDINTDINNTMSTSQKEDKKYTKDDVRLVDSLFITIAKIFPNHKTFVNRKAKDADYMELNKLHRIDGYDYKMIEDVLRWLYTAYQPSDDFDWKDQIQSVTKLRKHFLKLNRQYEKSKSSKKYVKTEYSTVPPSERRPSPVPVDDKPKMSAEDAEKNKLILNLVRLRKVAPNEMKSMKSKTIDELKAMAISV